MSDDFVRLVSQANPASGSNGGYARAGTGGTAYPPSQQLMDPFFDDEDEPDSAFGPGTRGINAGMQSKESFGAPLKSNAAPMAGAGQSKVSLGGQPQGWNFDDEDVAVPTLPTVAPHAQPKQAKRRRKGGLLNVKWPWAKEEKLEGERIVPLNTPGAGADFIHNGVSTSKYNVATFGPKFLFGAFLLASVL